MKAKIIGTGSMWNEYNSACYLIDSEIMVDFPNGACKYLYRENIKPNTINHVLITHFHGDHYFDIPFYLLNKVKSELKSTKIYCDKKGIKKIKRLTKLAFPNTKKQIFKELDINFCTKENFSINKYSIEKFLVNHGRLKPAYGYIFNENEKYIGFTGDTSLCKTVEYMAEKCNYLFCDCMLIEGNKKHQGIDNIEKLAQKYQNCTFVVSHLENETREKLNEKNIKNIIVPKDYMEIEI